METAKPQVVGLAIKHQTVCEQELRTILSMWAYRVHLGGIWDMLTISFIPFLSYNAQEENTSANAFPSSTLQSRNLSNSGERGPTSLCETLGKSHLSFLESVFTFAKKGIKNLMSSKDAQRNSPASFTAYSIMGTWALPTTPYQRAEFPLSRRWSGDILVGLFWVGWLALLGRWTQTAVRGWWVICRTRDSFRCICTHSAAGNGPQTRSLFISTDDGCPRACCEIRNL